jgi:hypothetical protein
MNSTMSLQENVHAIDESVSVISAKKFKLDHSCTEKISTFLVVKNKLPTEVKKNFLFLLEFLKYESEGFFNVGGVLLLHDPCSPSGLTLQYLSCSYSCLLSKSKKLLSIRGKSFSSPPLYNLA